MDEKAAVELDKQALEQILVGHMMAICGEANQIYRPVSMFDDGIDGEVEFRGNDGKPSGKKVYVQLESGDSHLSLCQGDGALVFKIEDPQHIECWKTQPGDVWLVIRHEETIRWMNVTRCLKQRKNKRSRQIVFDGETLDAAAVWRVRDDYIPR